MSGKFQISQNYRKVKIQEHLVFLGSSSSDVFTEADIHIQNTVVFNLKELYPRAKIIGEEDSVIDAIVTDRPFI